MGYDFCVDKFCTDSYYNCTDKEGARNMSPRTKSDKSKRNRFEIRLDDEMNNVLTECSKRLNTTKTDVITKGIKLVKSELDKK